MKNNKKLIISLVGVLIMLLLIISATYAYFSVTITGNGSKTMITANTPKKHSLSVSTLYDDIHIHVDNNDMKLLNVGSYYGAVNDNRYETDLTTGTHNIIEVSSKGMENIRYSCSGDIKVTLNIDNGSMGSVLEKEDVLLYLKGLGLDETLDLSTLKMNNIKVYKTSFEIDGNSSDYLSTIVELINKPSYQNYIANKMLNVKIEAENMVCRENGTYKYMVTLYKNIREMQNNKEVSKEVSLFYDDEGMYQKIQNVYLVDYIDTTKAIKTWELGDTERGTELDEVMGWLEATPNENESYDLYIGADGPMRAHKNMAYAFYNFTNLRRISGDALDTSEVTNMYALFFQDGNLTDINGLTNWDVSNVTTMAGMFNNTKINDITPLKDWNVSTVTAMNNMFNHTQITDLASISNWNVSNVTEMGNMFNYTSITDIIPITNWNTQRVISMGAMFANTKISDLKPISNWDISKVKNMSGMFNNCKNLTNLSPLANWNTISVTNMGSMFSSTNITDLNPLKEWNVSNVTDINRMFAYCENLVDISSLSKWDTQKVINMDCVFWETSINNISSLTDWDVSHVTTMAGLFTFTKISDLTPLSGWNTKNTLIIRDMFDGTPINDISAIQSWDVSSVTDISGLFYGTQISDLTPISGWNVSNVTTMSGMFSGTKISNLTPLKNWQVSKVSNMSGMFSNTLISDLTPLSDWDVSNVTQMGNSNQGAVGMFLGCVKLIKADLSNWNTPNLINTAKMFWGCSNLNEVYLPKANYNNITDSKNYNYMFTSVQNNITVYTESSQVEWVKARLQEALGENNNSQVIAYE